MYLFSVFCGAPLLATSSLQQKSQMIGNNDLWIAAHALASGLTLVTINEKEFRRVRGLKVQNWTT